MAGIGPAACYLVAPSQKVRRAPGFPIKKLHGAIPVADSALTSAAAGPAYAGVPCPVSPMQWEKLHGYPCPVAHSALFLPEGFSPVGAR